jgi:3-dehydroquinate dehydratase-1
MLKIGHLEIGPRPRVVGTLVRPATLAAIPPEFRPPCDIVELRLDRIGWESGEWINIARRIERAGRPVLLTVRGAGEGGVWTGPESRREELYHIGLDCCSAIDVELDSAIAAPLAAACRARSKTVVLSHHDFARTPDVPALRDLVRRAAAHGPVIVKIAATTAGPRDVQALRDLLAEKPHPWLCVIAMGEAAAATRWEFPRLGSCLAYGYLDEAGAPGQIPCGELVEKLAGEIPGYPPPAV